jgi:DNA sulfur modification protein DndD
MIIDSIDIENFGVYLGKQTVLLAPPSKNKPIILFGGQNGRGKTTLLNALQLGLYGKLANCSNRGQLGYEEYLKRSIHSSADPAQGASIAISFRYFTNGKEIKYKIIRSWSSNGKGTKEGLEVFKNDKFDRVLTDQWVEFFGEFLPPKLSNLFFFDGEKIESFADLDNASKLLSIGINSLLGVDLIEQLSKDLVVLERKKQAPNLKPTDKKEIEGTEKEIKQTNQNIESKRNEIGKLNNETTQVKNSLDSLQEKFSQEGGEIYEKRHELEANKNELKKQIAQLETELISVAKGPAPLFLLGNLLDSISLQDKKELSDANTVDLINILGKRDKDVIELCKKEKVSPGIIAKLQKKLCDDIASRTPNESSKPYLDLNMDSRSNLNNLNDVELPSLEKSIGATLKKYDETIELLNINKKKLRGVPGDQEIAGLLEEIKKRKIKLEGNTFKIKRAEEELSRLGRQKIILEKELEKKHLLSLEEKINTEDNELFQKKSKTVRDTLNVFHKEILKRHVGKIQTLILDSFNKLISKDSLIKDFIIDVNDFGITLQDSGGRTISPERLSAGERQLLAVSMLWGLARASGRALPSVIDTPLGRLDSSHRKNIVEKYFPFSSHQVFLLSTDEEVDREHYEKLKPWIGHSYLLNFDESTNATKIEKGYFW